MTFFGKLSAAFIIGVITLEILVATLLTYYLRDFLLSPEKIASVSGPQEGYYWTAAQYQLAFLRFEQQIFRYAHSSNDDTEELRLRYAILQSKFRVLTYPAELIHFFNKVPEYDASIKSLQNMMNNLEKEIVELEYDRAKSEAIIARLKANWPTVSAIANNTRETEIRQQETAFSDFYRKREIIYYGSLVLMSLFSIAILFLAFTFRRHREVNQQHRIALAAEQRATSTAKNIIEEKNRFLATVNHELRTPLQSIMAAVSIFIDRNSHKDNEKVGRRLESALLQLRVQLRDLSDYVRLESRSLELRKSKIVIREVIERSINDAQPFALKKGLIIHQECHVDDAAYLTDPERIAQILNNLLSNAIKYTKHGRIDVGTDIAVLEGRELLTIEVADTGDGIPEAKIDAIFEPFTRVSSFHTGKNHGMGMGLCIVKGLVGLLNGEVTVNSSSKAGTAFRVILPLERDTGQLAEPVHTT